MNSNAVSRVPDLPRLVRAFLEEFGLWGKPLLVGVSGGMDSTVLLRVLAELNLPLYASHIHYGLRGAESDADAEFVRALCDTLGIPLDTHHAPQPPSRGKQEWARDVRYARWLYLAETQQISAVAVAHHAEDQVETMLLNATRGAGLRGLGGMRPVRPWSSTQAEPWLIRPLIHVSRAELKAYAHARGWTWRDDASNADADFYRRNALRHRVVQPLAEWAGSGGMRHFAQTLKRVQDLEEVLKAFLPALEEDRLSLSALQAIPEQARGYALRNAFLSCFPNVRADQRLVQRLEALIAQPPGRKVTFPGGEVRRVRDGLWFVPDAHPALAELPQTFLLPGLQLRTSAGLLAVAEADGQEGAALTLPPGPVWVRSWRAGDRVVPPGRSREVRVSDLLVKAKVPLNRKPVWPVVGVGETVVWVPRSAEERCLLSRKDEPSLYLSFESVGS